MPPTPLGDCLLIDPIPAGQGPQALLTVEFLTLANSAAFFVEELEQEYARRGHVFKRPDGN
ncbi:hypothetical protein FBZ90_1352 [Nitrospirillum pindoramense]|uniref:Uncharacterized protein n=1 Tax=Nitrospirillum amazonense TaxID=28077 RepID=A0A560GI10_9PROT|nr:hypothetical protein FBZ90_1352 [Nitrospirillum amazonense]